MKNINCKPGILFLVLLISISLQAQFWGRKPILSPDIHPDNTVTLRIFAPDAKTVAVSGSWIPGWGTTRDLVRNDTGLYELTTEPLPSEMYTYNFVVNGVTVPDPANAIIVRDGQRNMSMFMVQGEKADLYDVRKVPHGTLEKVWYNSPSLGMDRRMYVYTPAGYKDSGKSYPVLYLLHGGGGDEDAWTTLGRAHNIMDNLIAAGKAKPMLVVMTNGNPGDAAAPGEGPPRDDKTRQEMGGMGQGRFEESLVKDVIPYIEKHYRVIAARESRAVTGLSMGGLQTLNLAFKYPGTFSYYGVMSMGLADMSRFGIQEDTKARDANLEILSNSGYKLYWVACGKDDFLYKSVLDLKKYFDDHNFNYIYRESEGGHTWENWRIYLSEFALMLFR